MTSQAKKQWVLHADAFDRLLSALDPDRDAAAVKYEALRKKLLRFFEWHGTVCPEDCADTALNVVARALAEGKEIHELAGYTTDVARLILLEQQRRHLKERSIRKTLGLEAGERNEPNENRERGLQALEHCLESLTDRDRQMILAYYNTGEGGIMTNRKNLAERLGLPLNAIRIRAHRIRGRLERCVKRAMGFPEGKTTVPDGV